LELNNLLIDPRKTGQLTEGMLGLNSNSDNIFNELMNSSTQLAKLKNS
jgi:hypothetical protein